MVAEAYLKLARRTAVRSPPALSSIVRKSPATKRCSMGPSLSRKIISGTFQLTLSNGLVRLFGIVSMPILTRLLSPEAYGAASLAGTVISLMSVFALAGIDMSYARAYHSAEPPSGAAVEAYCWRFALAGALVAAIIGAGAWWCAGGAAGARDGRTATLVALGIAFSVTQTMAQNRARLAGRYFSLSFSSVASGAVVVAASLAIAAFWHADALALLIPLVLGYAASVLLLGLPSVRGLVQPSGLSRNQGVGLIKIGLAGVVTAPLYWLLSSSDRWFLQHFHGDQAVGVYSIGYSVGIVGMMINNAITAVWLPEASREFEQEPLRAQRTLGLLMTRLVAAMALVWLAVAAAGGDVVRWMANERFHGAADCVPYVAGGVFFYGVLHLANTSLLLVKQLKWAALWWAIGGALCLLLNLALVRRFGAIGAALSQCLSFAAIALGILVTAQRRFPMRLSARPLLVGLVLIVLAGVFLTRPWHETAYWSLLMKLPAGMTVALVVLLLVEPDWRVRALHYMRQRAIA